MRNGASRHSGVGSSGMEKHFQFQQFACGWQENQETLK